MIMENNCRRHGFSLMETLVVVVVIVLAMLIFSLTQSYQQKAKAVKCTSNLRQLGMYIFQFATERNGDLLPALQRTSPGPNAPGIPWHQILNQEGILSYDAWHQVKGSIMHCPARKTPNPYSKYGNSLPSREFDGVHYGMNGYPGVNNMILLGEPRKKTASIPRPSRTILMMDTNWGYFVLPQLSNNRMAPHNDACGTLFADGHVEMLTQKLPVYTGKNPNLETELPPFF